MISRTRDFLHADFAEKERKQRDLDKARSLNFLSVLEGHADRQRRSREHLGESRRGLP